MSFRKGVVLPVVLSTLGALAGCGGSGNTFTKPVAPPSGGFSKSNLNGTYVFSVSGTDASGNPYAVVGTFTANGSGGISGGTLDINDGGFAPMANSPVRSGSSYNVGVDGRGQAQLSTSTPFKTVVLDFALQDSTHGLVTELDNNASGTGSLDLQSSNPTPTGAYAFIFSGVYSSSGGTPVSLVTVGNFTIGKSGVVSGLEDFGTALLSYPNETLSGTVVAGPSSTPGTQLVAALPSGGAVNYTITYDVYAIDATHLKFIEMDVNGTLSGDAFAQKSTSMPSNSTLAFTLLGATSSSVIGAGGFMVMDANGNITSGTEDVNNTGSFLATPASFSAITTPGGTARYALAISGFAAGTGTGYVAYPSSGGLLLLEIDSAGMMAGNALQQSSTASLANSQGYALNLSGTNLGTSSAVEVDDIAEFATSSSGGNLTGVTDENYAPNGVPNYALKLSGNYTAPDSNGRGQLSANAGNNNNGTLNGGFGLTYYTADGTVFPFIESDNGQVTVGVFLKQNSGASSSAATRSNFFVMPPVARPRIARRQN